MADGRNEAPVDYDRLQPIAKRVIGAVFDRGLSSLDDADQVFYLLWCYGALLDNGGHASFFYNSGADYFVETVDALDRAGLQAFSTLLTQSATAFFRGEVPREIEPRNAAMRQADVSDLDRAFFDADGGDAVLRALARYYPFP